MLDRAEERDVPEAAEDLERWAPFVLFVFFVFFVLCALFVFEPL